MYLDRLCNYGSLQESLPPKHSKSLIAPRVYFTVIDVNIENTFQKRKQYGAIKTKN